MTTTVSRSKQAERGQPAIPAAGATARIGLLGASGYTGAEFARLALAHPGLELAALCSREHAGEPVEGVLTGLDGRAQSLPPFIGPEALADRVAAGAVDTVVAALPHGAWKTLVSRSPGLAAAAHIVDLSSDHRDGSDGYRYGLPEAFRAALAGATRIANPGCYPTAAALALLPAAEAGWLAGPVMVSALSGASGAGRSTALRTSFVELDGGAAIYRAGEEHAHVPEMKRTLAHLTGADIELGFVPQLVPMARGILLTATVLLPAPLTPLDARAPYLTRYAAEPFVRVLDAGQWPETRAVRGSNRCDLQVTTIHGGRTLVAMAAIDNLVKGAAGQAIQNLNVMLGWPETTGLPVNGVPW